MLIDSNGNAIRKILSPGSYNQLVKQVSKVHPPDLSLENTVYPNGIFFNGGEWKNFTAYARLREVSNMTWLLPEARSSSDTLMWWSCLSDNFLRDSDTPAPVRGWAWGKLQRGSNAYYTCANALYIDESADRARLPLPQAFMGNNPQRRMVRSMAVVGNNDMNPDGLPQTLQPVLSISHTVSFLGRFFCDVQHRGLLYTNSDAVAILASRFFSNSASVYTQSFSDAGGIYFNGINSGSSDIRDYKITSNSNDAPNYPSCHIVPMLLISHSKIPNLNLDDRVSIKITTANFVMNFS